MRVETVRKLARASMLLAVAVTAPIALALPAGRASAAPAQIHGISVAAVGDTMLGNTPRAARRPRLLPRPGQGPAERRRRLRQPRGHAHRRLRLAQVRRRARRRLLRLPHAAELRPLPRRGRLHGDERRQQPLLRLRPGRASTRRSPRCTGPGSPRTGCRARSPWSRREGRRSPSSASPPTRTPPRCSTCRPPAR